MDPEFDEIPSERLQRILSELSNLPKLQLTSLESSSLFKVLPADARHMLDEQPGQLINALSLSKGKHPGMGMFPFLSTVSFLMGHGVVIGPADDADWWQQRGLFWSCTVAEPGAGKTPVINEVYLAFEVAQYAINIILAASGIEPIDLTGHSKTPEHMHQSLHESASKVKGFIDDEMTARLSVGAYKSGAAGAELETAQLLTLRTGGKIVSSTASKGTLKIPISHVALTGGMQPDNVKQYLASKNARSVGLEGRFAVMYCPAGKSNPAAVRAMKQQADTDQQSLGSMAGFGGVSAEKLSGMTDIFSKMTSAETAAESCLSAGVSDAGQQARSSSRPSSAASRADRDTTVDSETAAFAGLFNPLLQPAEAEEPASKKAKLLADPTRLLALVFVEVFLACWQYNEKLNAMLPATIVLTLNPDTEEGQQLSAYEVFDAYCVRCTAVKEELKQRRLDDRLSVVNKLEGTVLELAGVCHIVSHAFERLTAAAGSQPKPVPPRISLRHLVNAIDLVCISTLQRFLALDDDATVDALLPLFPHVSVFAEAALTEEGAAAAAADSQHPATPTPTKPPVWRHIIKALLTQPTTQATALAAISKTLFFSDHALAAPDAPSADSMVEFKPSCYKFSMPSHAMNAAKILTNAAVKNSKLASHVATILKGATTIKCAIAIACGEAGGILETLQARADQQELCLDELRDLQLPTLGDLHKLAGGNLVLVKRVPDELEDAEKELAQLQALKADLYVYGISLSSWFYPLQARFDAAAARVQQQQELRQTMMDARAASRLGDEAADTDADEYGLLGAAAAAAAAASFQASMPADGLAIARLAAAAAAGQITRRRQSSNQQQRIGAGLVSPTVAGGQGAAAGGGGSGGGLSSLSGGGGTAAAAAKPAAGSVVDDM